MKVIIQTLDKVCVDVIFEESQSNPTVMNLRTKLQEIKNHPVNQMRLIFSGQELTDNDKLLVDYGITNGSRVVLLLQKNKSVQPIAKVEEKGIIYFTYSKKRSRIITDGKYQ